MMDRREAFGLAVVAGVVLLVVRCGGSNSKVPTTPSTPTPAPAPAPTPTPVYIPGSYCKLGVGTDKGKCAVLSATFQQQMDDAIDKAMRDHPDNFYVGDGIRTRSIAQMYVAVVQNLEAQGFCVYVNPGDEVQVKNSNDFDDAFNIVTSMGVMRRPALYRGTCTPASFPLDNTALPTTSPDCSIAPSRSIFCERNQATYLDQVDAAINQIVATRPDLVDPTTVAPGTQNSFAVTDTTGFKNAVLAVLKGMGFCYHIDNEEIQIKKDDRLSEQFNIVTSVGFIRRGDGSYRSSCYPPAF